jgi:hypothetical protein
MFMNSFDIESMVRRLDADTTPNLYRGAQTLKNLQLWVDDHSDGWAYWPKPVRAAKRLMELLDNSTAGYFRGVTVPDVTDAELKAALTPIKSFLTRHGANHEDVIA